MPSPSSSSLPSSSSSFPWTPQYPLPLTQAFQYDTYRPGSLHLVPCSFEQFCDLSYEDKYELVEGRLWWKGETATHYHDEARDRLATEISRVHGSRGYEVVTERGLHVPGSSKDASTRSDVWSSSSASDYDSCTIRKPDIAVFQCSRAPNRGNLSPRSQNITFPRRYPPLLVLEVTCPSTRSVDLHSKWDEYERAAVQCYVIVDRAAETDPFVVVGILSKGRYRKTVYRGDSVVHGLLFDMLGFTAQYMLNPPRSITEIRNSPLRKLESRIRDLEHTSREQDRILRDQAAEKTDLKREIATLMGEEDSGFNGSTEKQSSSSSSPKGLASNGGSPSKRNSPSKSPKHKRSKLKE